MSKKILCPFHVDTTPSMHVYQNEGRTVGYCFVCSAQARLQDLEDKYTAPVVQTNIVERMDYINFLPTKQIRGLELPYDHYGFYVVWPDDKFYKRRNWEGKARYIGPSGHKPPLLVANKVEGESLTIVEGELNVLSLFSSLGSLSGNLVSPGSSSELVRHIKHYLNYKKIYIFVDNDAAGAVHGYQLKELLLKHRKDVRLFLLDKDFNDILQEHGKDAVKKEFRKCLGS